MLVVALGPVSTLILGRESKANMAWPFAMKTKLAFYFYIKSTNPKSFLGLFFSYQSFIIANEYVKAFDNILRARDAFFKGLA